MRFLVLACVAVAVFAHPADIRRAADQDNIDGEYGLDEGDMLEIEDTEFGPLNAITNLGRCWTDNKLYYSISSEFTAEEVKMIDDDVEHLMAVTGHCVTFHRRNNEAAYVHVTKSSSGCSATVGMSGGMNNLRLTHTCVRRNGTVMHEFLHSLGFRHEQSRHDRDDYVEIMWDNIRAGAENNFRKHSTSEIQLLDTVYDYGSVMHYSRTGFAIDSSKPTIVPHDPDAEIGQRTDMSQCDRERVQIFYGCLDPEESECYSKLTRVELKICGDD